MTATDKIKELEARRAAYVAECQQVNVRLRAARLAGGSTVEMRATAMQFQKRIENVNKELRQANLDLLSKSAGTELLPCPFCGGIAALTHDVPTNGFKRGGITHKLWYVLCVDPACGCRLRKKFSTIEAVRLWQERPAAIET